MDAEVETSRDPASQSIKLHYLGRPAVRQWLRIRKNLIGGVSRSAESLHEALDGEGIETETLDASSPRNILKAGLSPKPSAGTIFHASSFRGVRKLWPLAVLNRGHRILMLHAPGDHADRRPHRGWFSLYSEVWVTNCDLATNLRERGVKRPIHIVSPSVSGHSSATTPTPTPTARSFLLACADQSEVYGEKVALEVVQAYRELTSEDAVLTIIKYQASPGTHLSSLSTNADPSTTQMEWCREIGPLSQEGVKQAIGEADILLRPTSVDGDSLLVREALALGIRVIASDVVPRPAGVELSELTAERFLQVVLNGGHVSDGSGLGEPIDTAVASRLVKART